MVRCEAGAPPDAVVANGPGALTKAPTAHRRSDCRGDFIKDPYGILRCSGCCVVAGGLTAPEQTAWLRVRDHAVRVYHDGSFSVGADPSDHVVNDEDRALAEIAELKMSSSVEARAMRCGPPIDRTGRFAQAMRERIDTVSPEAAESIAELEARLRRDFDLPMPPEAAAGVPDPVFGVLATLPTEVLYPETAPYLKTLRDRSASDKERLDARRWLRNNGYAQLADVRAECERACDEIRLARLARVEGLPIVFAPQCGHQALTAGCSVCAVLREQMARVGEQRRQPVVHVTNHYDPATIADAFASGAGQKAVLEVIRFGNPVRRRAEEIAAEHATGCADRPYAERAAMLLCDEVNGIDDDAHLVEDGQTPTVEIAGFQPAPPRPDGFSQAQVDAAKAVLLAPVTKRGGR